MKKTSNRLHSLFAALAALILAAALAVPAGTQKKQPCPSMIENA